MPALRVDLVGGKVENAPGQKPFLQHPTALIEWYLGHVQKSVGFLYGLGNLEGPFSSVGFTVRQWQKEGAAVVLKIHVLGSRKSESPKIFALVLQE